MLIYRSADGSIKIDVRMGEETVWLTQDQMAALFGKAKSTINEHLKNIFSEGELVADSVIRNFRTPGNGSGGSTNCGRSWRCAGENMDLRNRIRENLAYHYFFKI